MRTTYGHYKNVPNQSINFFNTVMNKTIVKLEAPLKFETPINIPLSTILEILQHFEALKNTPSSKHHNTPI